MRYETILTIKETEKELLIAEEHIAGETLEEVLKKRYFLDREKLELALQLCKAVEFLHGCEPPVIHRDIKPSNILVTKNGELKLIDFDASRQYKEKRTESDFDSWWNCFRWNYFCFNAANGKMIVDSFG